jgi:archaeal preflagellin peptidase FlaK
MYFSYDIAALALALAGCYIGLRSDFWSGKIPNALTGTMLLLSGVLAFLRINAGDAPFLFLYLQNFALGFVIGIVFWYIRAWSGGDAKMFWALCSLLPAYPQALKPLAFLTLPWYSSQFFGLSILFNLLILLLIKFFLAAVFLFLWQGRTRELLRTVFSPFMYITASTLLGIGISSATGIGVASYLSIVFIFALSVAEQSSFLLFLSLWGALTAIGVFLAGAFSIDSILSLLYAQKALFILAFLLSAYAVGSRIPFTRKVAIKDLRLGMPIGEEIYLKGGTVKRDEVSASLWNEFVSWALSKKKNDYLVRPEPAGLSEEDLGKLRLNSDSLGGFVEVNTSFILMPFILAALLMSFFGDLLWMMLT